MLTFVCDTGNKYLSKMYNDYWMLDNGFLERPAHGDLRDLILRPHSQRDTVVVGPKDLLVTAYQRMKLYDVSQLPVMDGDAGRHRRRIRRAAARVRRRGAVPRPGLDRDGQQARPPRREIADRGAVAGVRPRPRRHRHGRRPFLGLITRIDLLNYLRRRVQ